MGLAREIILFAVLVVCGYTDIAKGKVYNWVTLPAILVGLVGNPLIAHLGGADAGRALQESLMGFAIGFGVFGVFYLAHFMAGGDVKLMGAIGAIKGHPFILHSLFWTTVMGGALALVVLLYTRILSPLVFGATPAKSAPPNPDTPATPEDEKKKEAVKARDTVPYGFAIALGTILALFKFRLGPGRVLGF